MRLPCTTAALTGARQVDIVEPVTSSASRIVLVALCAVLAFGTPLALAMAGDTGCATMQNLSQDGCDDCECDMNGHASTCAAHCTLAVGGVLLIDYQAPAEFVSATESISSTTSSDFQSWNGPPGLQPPR